MDERSVYFYQHWCPVDVETYFRQKMALNGTRTSFPSQLFLERESSLTLGFNWVHKSDYEPSNCWRYFASTCLRQFALFVRVDIPTRIIVFCFSFCLLNDITRKTAMLRRVATWSLIKTYRSFGGRCCLIFPVISPTPEMEEISHSDKGKGKGKVHPRTGHEGWKWE